MRSAVDLDLPDEALGERSLLYRAGMSLRLLGGTRGVLRLGVATALLTWLPPALLSAAEGTLTGGPGLSFSRSYGTHGRLLLAIPMLFVAEWLFTRRVVDVVRGVLREGLLGRSDGDALVRHWRQTRRLWDSSWVEVVLALITAVAIYGGLRTDVHGTVATWRHTADGTLSLAGWWYSVVSLPFFQFLLWRWGWRLLVWARLLWRMARYDLRLVPTHPDLAGGLGPLGVAHVDLAPLAFACSAMLSASIAEDVLYAGGTITDYVVPVVTFVVGITLALIAPLFLFSSQLLDVKQRGLLRYGTLASRYTRAFDTKWLRPQAPGDDELLGTADLQSLADLGNSFGAIRGMRLTPIAFSQILTLASAAAVPMLPLVLFQVPLKDMMFKIIGNLLGL